MGSAASIARAWFGDAAEWRGITCGFPAAELGKAGVGEGRESAAEAVGAERADQHGGRAEDRGDAEEVGLLSAFLRHAVEGLLGTGWGRS